MEDVYEYIEDYFSQALSSDERTAFEARCINDKAFAEDVAFYVASRQAIQQQLLQQKQQLWASETATQVHTLQAAPVKTLLRRLLPYAAAAFIMIVAALYFMLKGQTPQQLADGYKQKYLVHIDQTMGGDTDSLQDAIEAFNAGNYKKAKITFELLQLKHPGDADEKKYLGLVYLLTQDYDKALEKFDELAKITLKHNQGNFLKAITLMERSAEGDKDKAKQLLQQVVSENTEGTEQAKEWLKKW